MPHPHAQPALLPRGDGGGCYICMSPVAPAVPHMLVVVVAAVAGAVAVVMAVAGAVAVVVAVCC